MMPKYFLFNSCLTFTLLITAAQTTAQELNLETIMRDPKWMGSQPKKPLFSSDGKSILFQWNPDGEILESTWEVKTDGKKSLQKPGATEAGMALAAAAGNHSLHGEETVFLYQNGLFLKHNRKEKVSQLLQTSSTMESPVILPSMNIALQLNGQPFLLERKTGRLRQLYQFSNLTENEDKKNRQDSLLSRQESSYFSTLRRRSSKREAAEKTARASLADTIPVFNLNRRTFSINPAVSPSASFLAFQLGNEPSFTRAMVPSFINESGFSKALPSREMVGIRESSQSFFILDIKTGESFQLKPEDLPGIQKQPAFYSEYPSLKNRPAGNRIFFVSAADWNPQADQLLADVRSADNKDRWLMLWSGEKRAWFCVNHHRDEAWIGGPPAEPGSFGFFSNDEVWYLSEASGFSHLMLLNHKNGHEQALTSGRFEISDVKFHRNKKTFFYKANPSHPGEYAIFSLKPGSSQPSQLSPANKNGGYEFILSPDGTRLAYLFSTATRPWELFLQEAKPGAVAIQLTDKAASPEYQKMNVAEPRYTEIPASDGKTIYGRLYLPEKEKRNGAAVLFVHGAGYLQNAHKHWSYYFREFLFHQMLIKEGFTVLDLDYRGSAGYGRDWRTGIYRHMGGKDLSDQADGVRFLCSSFGIDPERIGIYGGSYGGFITLMALCTMPDVFTCGAALRSVTDWTHYNHGYTSNILNSPLEDSLAYRRSSPMHFADGLRGSLLMCHGMQDMNVHYQDIVRFSQRLIELKKQGWELASYPMEDHAFSEPESWLDEYRRIHKLFREELIK